MPTSRLAREPSHSSRRRPSMRRFGRGSATSLANLTTAGPGVPKKGPKMSGPTALSAASVAADDGRMTKYVYDFHEGSKDQKDLLGGKGAGLAEMTNLGLPVPPGFTISTEACRVYLEHGHEPPGLAAELSEHLEALERATGRTLGQADGPLLVSVRSAPSSLCPG